MKAEHTKGPYYCKERMVYSELDSTGKTLAYCKEAGFGEFIARACNSHEKLVEACKRFSCAPHHPTCPIAIGKGQRTITRDDCTCYVKDADAALALAEKGESDG